VACSLGLVRVIGGMADLEAGRGSLEGVRFFLGEIRSVAALGAAVFLTEESAVVVDFEGASFLVVPRVAMNLSL